MLWPVVSLLLSGGETLNRDSAQEAFRSFCPPQTFEIAVESATSYPKFAVLPRGVKLRLRGPVEPGKQRRFVLLYAGKRVASQLFRDKWDLVWDTYDETAPKGALEVMWSENESPLKLMARIDLQLLQKNPFKLVALLDPKTGDTTASLSSEIPGIQATTVFTLNGQPAGPNEQSHVWKLGDIPPGKQQVGAEAKVMQSVVMPVAPTTIEMPEFGDAKIGTSQPIVVTTKNSKETTTLQVQLKFEAKVKSGRILLNGIAAPGSATATAATIPNEAFQEGANLVRVVLTTGDGRELPLPPTTVTTSWDREYAFQVCATKALGEINHAITNTIRSLRLALGARSDEESNQILIFENNAIRPTTRERLDLSELFVENNFPKMREALAALLRNTNITISKSMDVSDQSLFTDVKRDLDELNDALSLIALHLGDISYVDLGKDPAAGLKQASARMEGFQNLIKGWPSTMKKANGLIVYRDTIAKRTGQSATSAAQIWGAMPPAKVEEIGLDKLNKRFDFFSWLEDMHYPGSELRPGVSENPTDSEVAANKQADLRLAGEKVGRTKLIGVKGITVPQAQALEIAQGHFKKRYLLLAEIPPLYEQRAALIVRLNDLLEALPKTTTAKSREQIQKEIAALRIQIDALTKRINAYLSEALAELNTARKAVKGVHDELNHFGGNK